MKILLTGTSSDAHTWGLNVVAEGIRESGHWLVSLGSPTPLERVVAQTRLHVPDLVVVATTNGHGASDGRDLIRAMRASGLGTAMVIGGRLTTRLEDEPAATRALLVDGYERVFVGPRAFADFRMFLAGRETEVRRAREAELAEAQRIEGLRGVA